MSKGTTPERPSVVWRRQRDEENRQLADGTHDAPDEAFLAELFPDAFLDPLDGLLATYEADVKAAVSHGSGTVSYRPVYAAVEKLVLALNELNENGDGAYIETGEREALCEYIEQVIEAEGVRVEDLGKEFGFVSGELTDEWRDW